MSQHESATPVQIRVSPKNKIPVAPGDVFGRLTVIREVEHAVNWPRRLECRCECGNTAVALLANMTRGRTVSCGCWGKKARVTHGMSYATEYRILRGIIQRCENPNHKNWKHYGGRGITVCDRWRNSFAYFLEDMGPRPPGMTIDRIDNSQGYFPSNCAWRNMKAQNRHTRKSVYVDFGGERMVISQACEISGIGRSAVEYRKRSGLPESEWFLPVNVSNRGKRKAKPDPARN